jgi:hypothetical protein
MNVPTRVPRVGSARGCRTVHRFLYTLLACLAVSLLPESAIAQTNTAEIAGEVRDPQGGVLPGATVTVSHVGSGFSVVRVSDQVGRFFMPGLPVGEYAIVVELEGFRQFTQKRLVLTLRQKIDLPVTLQLGPLTDAITVTGEVPLLQTANAEVADVIDNLQVVQLPLDGRQFMQLAQLSDGVVVPPGGTRGAALEQVVDNLVANALRHTST